MKADIQATAQGNQVHSDFKLTPQTARLPTFGGGNPGMPPPIINSYSSFATTQAGQRNGGGNPMKLHTTVGKIEIKLFN